MTEPATDHPALRHLLAQALARHDAVHARYSHGFANRYGVDPETDGFVDAMAAVMGAPTDRATVLREEAALIRAHCPDHLDANSADGSWMNCHCDVADDMERRAVEARSAQQDQAHAERPRCPHCGLPHDLNEASGIPAVCASIRASIADADRRHAEGDHGGCAAVACDVVRARRAEEAAS